MKRGDGCDARTRQIREGIAIAFASVVPRTRRALSLAAETVREIGTLMIVFAPLESAFADRPLDVQLLAGVIATSLALIACAILVEARD